MGRKSQPKQVSKKEWKERQQRKELASLVDKLLKLTSTFQASNNLSQSWDHHYEIELLLQEVRKIESRAVAGKQRGRQANIDKYLKWLSENGAQFEGVEIAEFEGYDLGLKATKPFPEGSLILTVPSKLMMTEKDAQSSDLSEFISVDPLLQNMPNITLALFLLLEKNNPESFWKPYIDVLPEKYSTVLYFTPEELALLKPSPVYESSLKLSRSIARQYAYFHNKIHTLDIPVLKKLQDIFTYDNYRWAVSTVMTRQNNFQHTENAAITAFIPLWDMCNHEQGKITTDFNKELSRGECYALRDFKPGEQIFIYYGPRSNADLFLHNGFVYPNNPHDSLSIPLGISPNDPLREARLALLNKLGLGGVTNFNLYKGKRPLSAELLAFIRIFTMSKHDLAKWAHVGMPGDLVNEEPTTTADIDGTENERRAYNYVLTRCKLIKNAYKEGDAPESIPKTKIRSLHICENNVLDGTIKYLETSLNKLPPPVTKND